MKIGNTQGLGLDRLKFLIFGEPGSGKTTLAATIEEPTLVVSAEAGLLPLRHKSIDVIDLTLDDKGVLIPKEKRIARLLEVYNYLTTEEAIKKYRWVFIDSLTEISQNMVEALNVEFPDRKDSLVLYGENAKRMRALIKSFRDIPHYNVVFTALSAVDKDENGQRFTGVSMIGKVAEAAPGFFDEVFYAHVEKGEGGVMKYQLATRKTEKLVVKDRSGVLDPVEPSNLTAISKKIRGAFQEKKEEKKNEPVRPN